MSANEQSSNELLTPEETAKYLKTNTGWLAKFRCTGAGPPFLKIGHYIRYDKADLERWIQARRVTNTAEAYDVNHRNHPETD